MKSSRYRATGATRQLLIALNAADRIDRAALCILSADHERWRDLDVSSDLGPRAAGLGVTPIQLRRALELRPRAAELARRELERADRRGCRLITRLDDDYPRPLLDLALPPPVLYCRGRIPAEPAIAIVGSRKMDSYGASAARLFGRRLAAAGVTVVSGFALGVDTTAHRAALEAGGETVAVLGCGIDVDYPRGSAPLAAEISEHGAVLSEFALGAEPRPWRFPVRNRVIAALAVGTLVVQATYKSGSLITAHHALELGRDVYAVPGRIFDPGAQGTNALIADGALPAGRPRDLLESLSIGVQQELFQPPEPPSDVPSPPETGPARQPPAGLPGRILEALIADRGRTAEEVSARTEAAVEEVVGGLLELELSGWVRRAPGPVYLRI